MVSHQKADNIISPSLLTPNLLRKFQSNPAESLLQRKLPHPKKAQAAVKARPYSLSQCREISLGESLTE